MLILYTEADLKGENVVNLSNWYDDRIVSCLRHRPGIYEGTRKIVRDFKYDTDSTSIKHYVPWSRIMNQIIVILTTMGTENGKGMTRRQSVQYLKWVLGELEMATIIPDDRIPDDDFVEAIGVPQPKTDPAANRYSYDKWISWAVDSICDWPSNLFQGASDGDGGGSLLDKPASTEEFVLRWRIWEASLWLKLTIPGLKLAPRLRDPEYGWALHIDKLWDQGPPSQSRHHQLSDPWFLPIYKRTSVPNESENHLAAPDELLQAPELKVVNKEIKGKLTYFQGQWGFR